MEALSALAEDLHFGRAAARLSMTQPSLSQLLRDLELQVGVALIERTTRRVSLTPAGAVFVKDAREILARLDHAAESARQAAGGSINQLRVGAPIWASFSFLPKLLRSFKRRYPAIEVEVQILDSHQIVTALEQKAVHVGLLRPPSEPGALNVKSLYQELFVAAMQDDHPLAAAKSLTLGHFRGEVVTRIVRSDLRQAFTELDRALGLAGLDLERSRTAPSTLAAIAVVAANGGVGFVPAWVSAVAWSGLAFRPVEDLDASIDLAIAWRADRGDATLENFIEMASQQEGPRPHR